MSPRYITSSLFPTMKKFTTATLKSILKNKTCSIKVRGSFDGMTDGIEYAKDPGYREIDKASVNFENKYTLGVIGLWLVGSSRDSFRMISDNEVRIDNCCGTCEIKFA